MIYNELPLGFMFALSGNKSAMQTFSAMSEDERNAIVSRARFVKSKEDMQLLVESMSDGDSSYEFH